MPWDDCQIGSPLGSSEPSGPTGTTEGIGRYTRLQCSLHTALFPHRPSRYSPPRLEAPWDRARRAVRRYGGDAVFVACSTLSFARYPLDQALRTIVELGF